MTEIPHHELLSLISKHPDIKYDPNGESCWTKGVKYYVCETSHLDIVLHWAVRNAVPVASSVAIEIAGSGEV